MRHDNTEARLSAAVRELVSSQPPGARLSSVRELMATHHVSPLTVQRAISRLVAEGPRVAAPRAWNVRRRARLGARACRRSLLAGDPLETAPVLFNLAGWTYIRLRTGHGWDET